MGAGPIPERAARRVLALERTAARGRDRRGIVRKHRTALARRHAGHGFRRVHGGPGIRGTANRARVAGRAGCPHEVAGGHFRKRPCPQARSRAARRSVAVRTSARRPVHLPRRVPRRRSRCQIARGAALGRDLARCRPDRPLQHRIGTPTADRYPSMGRGKTGVFTECVRHRRPRLDRQRGHRRARRRRACRRRPTAGRPHGRHQAGRRGRAELSCPAVAQRRHGGGSTLAGQHSRRVPLDGRNRAAAGTARKHAARRADAAQRRASDAAGDGGGLPIPRAPCASRPGRRRGRDGGRDRARNQSALDGDRELRQRGAATARA